MEPKDTTENWPDLLPIKGIVTKRMTDIFLARVSKSLEAFVSKSDRTVQNEGKQKHPPQQ